jgi:hypothetical protein
VLSLTNAARNTYYDNPGNLNQIDHNTASLKAFVYNPPAEIIKIDDNQLTVWAYPSSYWDDWQFRAYEVTWNRHVWIDSIYKINAEDHTYVTAGYIDFNPKGTAEGELTVRSSGDGRHDGCDFSAITGFEKSANDYHLSIWTSRVTRPEAV